MAKKKKPKVKKPVTVLSHTTETAIKAGALIRPYPASWPSLIFTPEIHKAIVKYASANGMTYQQLAMAFLIDCLMAARNGARPAAVPEVGFGGEAWIVDNDVGGFTAMRPEEY